MAFPNAQPTYDDFLNRLPILDAVTKEAMRIHPAVSNTERIAMRDDILPLRTPVRDPRTGELVNSVVIKKGQVSALSRQGREGVQLTHTSVVDHPRLADGHQSFESNLGSGWRPVQA